MSKLSKLEGLISTSISCYLVSACNVSMKAAVQDRAKPIESEADPQEKWGLI